MMNEKKSYKVKIFDDQYLLVSNEPELFVQKAADIVDALMKEVSNKAIVTDPKKIAVLAALHLADKLLNIERAYDDTSTKTTALIDFVDQEISMYLFSCK